MTAARRHLSPLPLLALAAVLAGPGCANQFSPDPAVSQVQRLVAANAGYAATVRTLTALRTAGKIDDATALRVEAGMKVIDGLLADARVALGGDAIRFDRTLAAAMAALADLDRAANRAESGVPANGT
jgi:hypothetical protein